MSQGECSYKLKMTFLLNIGTTCTVVQYVSLPNLNSSRPSKRDLWAKEVGDFFIMLFGKMGRWIILLPTNMAAAIQMCKDFLNLEEI